MKKALLILALTHTVPALPLHGETIGCTGIVSLPATISTPGIYCLDANLTLAPPYPDGIVIASDDVVLDLNGHSITATPESTGAGIRAFNRQGVTVKNGIVRGFAFGVILYGSNSASPVLNGLVVDSMRVEATMTGIDVESSRGATITGNAVTVRSSTSGLQLTGIRFSGDSATFSGNDVQSLFPISAGAYGILLTSATNSVVEGNRVKNLPYSGSVGVYVSGNNNLVAGNRVTNTATGFSFTTTFAAKYRDNLTIGTGLAYGGGTNAGNNQ